jgi:hypothetical protein
MTRLRTLAAWATLGLGLAFAAAAPASAQDDPDEAAPSPLPTGNGCAAVVARWQDFSGQEEKGGHMDDSVYKQIQAEIDRASQLCEAGQDAQARRAVAESKRRHGYPQ